MFTDMNKSCRGETGTAYRQMAHVWPAVCNRFQALVIKPSGMITNEKKQICVGHKLCQYYNQNFLVSEMTVNGLTMETLAVFEACEAFDTPTKPIMPQDKQEMNHLCKPFVAVLCSDNLPGTNT